MKIGEIRNMKKEEIEKQIAQLYSDLRNTNLDILSGKEKDVKKGLKIRKIIARMLTVLKEMETKKVDEKE